ncbi:MAG TPA: hypothetical protein VFX16_20015 [Pseudonocardiaceae bacterium]|nr:hypothetical protein [Pseudonocardiaceae bacterium]
MSTAPLTLDVDDVDEVSWEYARRGWSDGLPIVPPTPERVARMLAGVTDPERLIAVLPPRNGRATIEMIAVNAVMAGCRPEYLRVVVAALTALGQPAFNLRSIQATTHPASPLLIVNGPIRQELGVHGGSGCFGAGFLANATIGRAVRLVLRNVGGGIPGSGDRATHGHPGKYSYCIAENEEENPWQPLHVDRGFDAGANTVTVIGCEAPHNINNHVGDTAEHILGTCADGMIDLGTNNPFATKTTQMTLVLCPEHAATVAGDGWSKDDVRKYLYERARRTLRELKTGGLWNMHSWPNWYDVEHDDARLPVVSDPSNFVIVVAGGEGKHSTVLPTTGSTRSVTVEIPALL